MPARDGIDILQLELDGKLPHWLNPQQKNFEQMEAIRRKHRAKWLAEQEAQRKTARWVSVKSRALQLLERTAYLVGR
jgi:hypothetical protein